MDTATEASRIIDGTNEEELDRFLRVLANPIRRYLFQELFQERDTVVSIDKLCDAIAADIDGEITKKELQTALLHIHLPMLSEAGIVDVDREQGRVWYHDGHRIETLLRCVLSSVRE